MPNITSNLIKDQLLKQETHELKTLLFGQYIT